MTAAGKMSGKRTWAEGERLESSMKLPPILLIWSKQYQGQLWQTRGSWLPAHSVSLNDSSSSVYRSLRTDLPFG